MEKNNKTFGPQNFPDIFFSNHYLIAFQKNPLDKNLAIYV